MSLGREGRVVPLCSEANSLGQGNIIALPGAASGRNWAKETREQQKDLARLLWHQEVPAEVSGPTGPSVAAFEVLLGCLGHLEPEEGILEAHRMCPTVSRRRQCTAAEWVLGPESGSSGRAVSAHNC